jgi:hypothetical protein
MRADVRRLHLALVVVALGATGRAEGQGIADLPAGARVRITLPDSARLHPFMPRAQSVIGTLARAGSDTLWLQVAGPDPLRVPRGTIREVEVSRGVSRTRSALQFGLGMGVGVGLVGYASADDADSRQEAVLAGAIGAVLGGVVGAVRPYERWKRVR